MFVRVFDDPEEHARKMWKAVAVAARYGHQQLDQVMSLELDHLAAFNDAVTDLIRDENEKGGGYTNKIAEGGG